MIFGRQRKRQAPRPSLPAGRRIYCIGDIHGRADLLEALHDLILGDATHSECEACVVYLGDYIDRGEASARVIEILLGEPLPKFETVFLMGNHEQALLDFLVDPLVMADWLQWGGQSTLRSYGIHLPILGKREELIAARDQLDAALPPDHRTFFEACRPAHAEGDYFFVHAGVRPGVRLESQAFEDLLWIREEFLDSRRDHGAVVVHGHSVKEQVEFLPNRIGIDTGAYRTGVLTALVLEGTEQRLIQTGAAT